MILLFPFAEGDPFEDILYGELLYEEVVYE